MVWDARPVPDFRRRDADRRSHRRAGDRPGRRAATGDRGPGSPGRTRIERGPISPPARKDKDCDVISSSAPEMELAAASRTPLPDDRRRRSAAATGRDSESVRPRAPAVAELCRQMEARGFRAEIDAAGNAIGIDRLRRAPDRAPRAYRHRSRSDPGPHRERRVVGPRRGRRQGTALHIRRRGRRGRARPQRDGHGRRRGRRGASRFSRRQCRRRLGRPGLLRHRRAKRLGRRLPRLPRHTRVPLPSAPTVAPHRRTRRIGRRASHRVLERPGRPSSMP